MTNVSYLQSAWEEREPTLKAGGGDGTFDGMEARVAKLEANVDHLVKQVDRLAAVPERLATVEADIKHLPSKGFIVTATVGALAFFSAVTLFGERLLALIGSAP